MVKIIGVARKPETNYWEVVQDCGPSTCITEKPVAYLTDWKHAVGYISKFELKNAVTKTTLQRQMRTLAPEASISGRGK